MLELLRYALKSQMWRIWLVLTVNCYWPELMTSSFDILQLQRVAYKVSQLCSEYIFHVRFCHCQNKFRFVYTYIFKRRTLLFYQLLVLTLCNKSFFFTNIMWLIQADMLSMVPTLQITWEHSDTHRLALN
jgi:hypothetical protein